MEYKVGDKVRILHRDKSEYDYPFTFVDDMAALEGKEFTISDIIESSDPKCDINGDYHRYFLEEIGYDWHSSMFEKVDSWSSLNTAKSISIETGSSTINIKSTNTIKIILWKELVTL